MAYENGEGKRKRGRTGAHLRPWDDAPPEKRGQVLGSLTAMTQKWLGKGVEMLDAEAVNQRLIEYYCFCEENLIPPTVSGACIALGCSKERLFSIRGRKPHAGRRPDEYPRAVFDAIDHLYLLLEEAHVQMGISNSGNVAMEIFWLKNNAGYADKVEHSVIAGTLDEETLTADEIAEKYRLSDSGSVADTTFTDSEA